MKNKYEKIEIEIYALQDVDIVRTSIIGEVDGDETKYPINSDLGWGE